MVTKNGNAFLSRSYQLKYDRLSWSRTNTGAPSKCSNSSKRLKLKWLVTVIVIILNNFRNTNPKLISISYFCNHTTLVPILLFDIFFDLFSNNFAFQFAIVFISENIKWYAESSAPAKWNEYLILYCSNKKVSSDLENSWFYNLQWNFYCMQRILSIDRFVHDQT